MPDVQEQPAPATAAQPVAFEQRTPGAPAANPWAPPIPKNSSPKPKLTGRLTIHFLVPTPAPPARHMISGGLGLPQQLRTFADAISNPAPAGQGYAAACNPRLSLNELNIGTVAPWALLAVLDNEAVIDPSACEVCMATEAWKKSIQENPHPRIRDNAAEPSQTCCG
jgi:hypothetical protein